MLARLIVLVSCLAVANTWSGAVRLATNAWIHPKCSPLPLTRFGPFLEVENGKLLAFDGRSVLLSADEGRTWTPTYQFPRGPATAVTEPAASWQREELSIAFSRDEAKTWSKPLVIARHKKGLSYPFLLQHSNGDVWVTTRFPNRLAFRLRPGDFPTE